MDEDEDEHFRGQGFSGALFLMFPEVDARCIQRFKEVAIL